MKRVDDAVNKNNNSETAKEFQQQLVNKDKKIAQLNYLLSEQKAHVEELVETIDALQNSTSWKISAPIRSIEKNALRLKALARTLKRTLGFGGGLISTIKKVIRIFSQEGFQGIRMRVRHIKQHHEPITATQYGRNLNTYSRTGQRKNIDYLKQMREIDLSPYDVISLDVFDTALIRLCTYPGGVFSYIEEQHLIPDFKKKRLKAESNARSKYNKQKDISLQQIYQEPELSHIDPQLEIKTELQFCVANPIIYDLYMRAKVLKKKIYFVSDMYLSKEHITQLLQAQGYHDYDQLYVSSEDDLIKGDGSRFIALKEELTGQKIIHLGDNYLADYEWPKKHGFDAVHYQPVDDFFKNDIVVGSLYDGLKNSQSLGLAFILGEYKRWKYGDKSGGWGLWRDIGFLFGGPLLYLFSHYIHQYANKQSNTQLCFLARDGLIIKKVYDLLYKTADQESIYTLASRRAMTFPVFAMDKADCQQSKLLDIYQSTHSASSAAEVFERIAYPELSPLLHALQELEKKGVINNDKAIKAKLLEFYPELNAKAKIELNGLLNYLEQKQLLDPNKHSVVVDVGWVGTIQDSLNSLMDYTNQNKQFTGLYLGVLPVATNSEIKHGFLFDKENQDNYFKLAPFRNFIELLTAAPVPGLVHFTTESPYAIFDEQPSPQEAERLAIAKEIQHGIMDFVHSIKKIGLDQLPTIDSTDIIYLFELLQQQASPELIALLSQTKHARLPSNAFTHSVIEF